MVSNGKTKMHKHKSPWPDGDGEKPGLSWAKWDPLQGQLRLSLGNTGGFLLDCTVNSPFCRFGPLAWVGGIVYCSFSSLAV